MTGYRTSLIAAALLGSAAVALAQGAPPPSTPIQPNAAGESQQPNAKPGGGGQGSPTRPSASQSDQAVPPHASETHSGNNTAAPSMQGAGGPPGASAQTMPSTIDAGNAREDKRIIMEHALELKPEQRQKIAQMLANASGTSTAGSAPESGANLAVGNTVPSTVSMHEFPSAMVEQMPELGKYKYVQLPGKVLVIEPNNRIVVAEIAG